MLKDKASQAFKNDFVNKSKSLGLSRSNHIASGKKSPKLETHENGPSSNFEQHNSKYSS